MNRLLLVGALLYAPGTIAAQTPPSRRVVAVRLDGVTPPPPALDGRLDDPAWAVAEPASGFLLREPTEGAPAPEETAVRFVYTRDALYIGARMHSATPTAIRALVTRRDGDVPTEQLTVSLDTRADRRTAYTFAITPGGVRTDYFNVSDFEDDRDYSFDPVWEAKTAVDSAGWTAEIRIPFTQLRFNPGAEQTWGLNLVRHVPARNEEGFWMLVRRDETGWSSRMGRLEGIRDIPPSRRVELVPYVAGNATRAGVVDPGDPFAERYQTGARAGGDLKMGLGPNLTLDATFNPDFGQVEADPAEVNLTAFETFFDERRPFFIEGSDLFGGRGTFYSRRIGSRPPLGGSGDYAESRDNTTILGAAKMTGRLASGLALGVLSAVTAEEQVETYDVGSGTFGRDVVAPLTGYGIVTARQEFGRNRSTLAGTLTAVERDVDPGSPLAAVVARHAYSALIDGRLRWNGGRMDASAYLGTSFISGDSTAILGQQRSSRRYFQRPDAAYVDVDSSRTSLSGITAGINHSKLAGNWLWDIDLTYESPGLELNDMGALGSTDDMGAFTDIRYRRTQPGPVFHNWSLGLSESAEWNTGGIPTSSAFGLFGSATLKNFWGLEFDINVLPRGMSDNQTRGGPLMRTPQAVQGGVELSSRRGARTSWEVETFFRRDELEGSFNEAEASLSLRPGTQWELSLSPRYSRIVSARQFVTTDTGGPAAAYGGRYIFGRLDRSEIVAQFRASYAVTPNLTVEAYLEPFASSGRYSAFGELAAAQTFDLRTYGTSGTTITRNGDSTYTVVDGADSVVFGVPDFDVRSLRSNLVLRWEWQPGSTLFLVWQQERGSFGIPTRNVGPGQLWDAFRITGDHFLAVKANYWIALR